MKLSIVVPCYNEAKNIPLILERFSAVIKREDIEVILVNNGSTDQTAKILKEWIPKYSFARTVLVEKNQGYGYGILQGLQSCKSEYVGWTHADMQTDPADVIRGLEVIESKKYPGIDILRFEVRFPKRIYGKSKWNTGWKAKWKFIKRTILFSIKLKKGGIR